MESQNTYLFASGHVNGLCRLHRIPVSNSPVPQHPSSTTSNPDNQQQTRVIINYYLNPHNQTR